MIISQLPINLDASTPPDPDTYAPLPVNGSDATPRGVGTWAKTNYLLSGPCPIMLISIIMICRIEVLMLNTYKNFWWWIQQFHQGTFVEVHVHE